MVKWANRKDEAHFLFKTKVKNNSLFICRIVNYCLPLNIQRKEMKSSELFKKLKKDGWFEISQEGSHIKMKHPSKQGILIYPYHGSKEVGKGLEKAIKKQAGI